MNHQWLCDSPETHGGNMSRQAKDEPIIVLPGSLKIYNEECKNVVNFKTQINFQISYRSPVAISDSDDHDGAIAFVSYL